MATITVPAKLFFTDVELWNDRVTSTTRSPFTGKRQTRKRPYDIWGFVGNLMPLDPMDAGAMRSFLMQLGGQSNNFRLPVPGAKYPLSKFTGTQGLVNGAGQTGKSISTDGWSINSQILADGDYFNIGDELKVCVGNIASNGSGVAVINFEPPIRAIPADNAAIRVRDPYVLLSADNDDVARWNVKAPVRHAFKLEATEDF